MSHFTTVKTKLKDLTCIKKAVQDLGLTFIESDETVEVRGYQGATTRAKMVIRATDHYDIAVRQSDSGYILEAYWWGIEMGTGLREQDWVDRFNQRYAYNKVIAEVTERGFTLEEEVDDAGEIKLTVRKWQP